MPISQCPKCELRFTNDAELQDHLETDHEDQSTEERETPTPKKM